MSKTPPPSGPPKTATPPVRPAPPPPPPSTQGPPAAQGRTFAVQTGRTRQARRIVLYGPGGVGKSTLAANLAKVGIKPLFLDLAHGTEDLDTDRIAVESFDDVRGALASEDLWKGYGAVVLDTMTDCEELINEWVIRNIPHEKAGKAVRSIEDYGFGKGYHHNYSSSLMLFGDFDRHIRENRHVVVIAHDCTANVPNPGGDDFLRYEPRLQSPKSGKDSIRHRLKEWCDDLFFVDFDQHVTDEGKAVGAGSRTIYGNPLPIHWAKSRKVVDPVHFQDANDATLWEQLLG